MAAKNRRAEVASSMWLNGIDYIDVDPSQTLLTVHFLNAVPVDLSNKQVIITGGDSIPTVAVDAAVAGPTENGRPTVQVSCAYPGDFSTYTLTIALAPTHLNDASELDVYLDHAEFSFKATCPSTLDCKPVVDPCEPPPEPLPAIDYLAKDFDSFKRALLDFSAQYYPAWQERSEADFGVMFAEALASIADDLSYQQDRITGEAYLETARERRSLVRLGRLVDYEPRVATAARVTLWLEVQSTNPIPVPASLGVSTRLPDGTVIEFETLPAINPDLDGTDNDPLPDLHRSWNAIRPYWFDDADQCLCCGATEMWIEAPEIPPVRGQRILIETAGPSTADLPVCQIVTVTDFALVTDMLQGIDLLHVTWSQDDALVFEHDLTHTTVRGNLVDAIHGRTCVERFVVEHEFSGATDPPRATVRLAAGGTPQFLHTLRNAPLASLASSTDDKDPRPEIRVGVVGGEPWFWHQRLIETGQSDPVYTVDPARFALLDYWLQISDYDGDEGATIRFGDGTRGRIPAHGTLFEVTYRVGGGARGNVAASTLTKLDPFAAALGITAVNNPLHASGGRDEEPEDQVRDRAPEKFRRNPLRAVRPEDYERAAMEDKKNVQRAGTRFRYTGSWLSVFTSVDPRATEVLRDDLVLATTQLLDRRRMAGYESFVVPPRFAPIDLRITVCALSDAFRGDVERCCLQALDTRRHRDGTLGFFHPDRFTFEVPLERSALEARLQDVPGLDGVLEISYRWRGHTRGYVAMSDAVVVGLDEIVRCDNDPDHPERGSLRIIVRGGK